MSMGGGMGGAARVMYRMGRDVDTKGHRLAPGLVRRVLAFARPFRRMIVGFLVLVIIDAALSVTPPLLFKEIIDRGVLAGDRGLVIGLAVVVAVLAVVDAGLGLVERWLSSRIGEGLIYDLRTRVFDHVSRMPVAFFTRTQTGKLVSRLNSDVIGAQQAFTSTLSTVVSNLISLVLVLAAMLVLSWPLTLAALVMLPVFLIPARLMGRKLADLTRQQMQLNGELSETMTERFSVSGALLVKLFGRPRDEHDQFAGRAGAVRDVSVSIAMNGRIFMTSLTLVAALATALVYGVGGVLSIRGALTVGTLTALSGLLVRLYGPLTQLTNLRIDVMTALVSFERVFEVLDLPPMIADAEDARDYTGPASVRFDHVAFTYPKPDEVSLASLESVATVEQRANEPVLHDISFTAEPGQTVALVGPSGAGKTTITHLIARLYDTTGGTVEVGGVDVRGLTLASLQHAVGYVTQDAHMFHDTIRANLLYARPDATDAQMREALAAAQVLDLVDRLPDGLETVVGERGYRLSGGERQRLAIARLLLKAPPVVVLDEATAHLDSESEAAVQRALDTAMEGRTSIVIAHRLSTVREADQILVVSDGRIAQRGTHADLLAEGGLYAELYRTQFAEGQTRDAAAREAEYAGPLVTG
ncbi:ATP-binding cassette subfamily B protein [Friedmanniella endophytica]|uniref:ATP-binding cassette subfamily B protein n=1 Tax=Microlunatus kandeliicorticis TaxID=1759536 RepID=A0A7W3P5T8_9ACTN|nr:ABC transporter ATP-binding protein [Microlunatus kandeliicorticis]MBA8794232.1 ATP-binding cassette subfamily B protein [Microlunatus kandeliicorticis]